LHYAAISDSLSRPKGDAYAYKLRRRTISVDRSAPTPDVRLAGERTNGMSKRQELRTPRNGAPFSRRSLLAGAAAGATALSLGSRSRRVSATQGSNGEVNVLYLADQHDHFKTVAEAFTAETGIGVKYETLPSDYLSGQQLLTTRLVAGDTDLDVFWCDDFQSSMYGAAGWLEPLDPIVEEFGIQLDDYVPTLITDVSTWDGALYRLPWTAEPELIFYRTDYFEEAGVELPANWDEFVTVATALTNGSDRYGIGLCGQKAGTLGNEIQHWANQAGGAINALDTEGSKQAITFYKDLFTTHKVAPPSTPQEDYNTVLQGFLDGKYAVWWVWDVFFAAMTTDETFWKDQVSVMVPQMAGPQNAETSIGCWGWAINGFSGRKDQAKQWVEFTSRPEIMKHQMLRGNAPARTSLWADPEYQERAPQLSFMAQMIEGGESPFRARPVTPGIQEIYDAAEQNVHAFLTDQVDLDTAVAQAMEKIRPILERYSAD